MYKYIFFVNLQKLNIIFMDNKLLEIVQLFDTKGEIKNIKPMGEGFINDTFIVETFGDFSNYILQRKNKNIFTDVPAMMDNILKVTEHIRPKASDSQRDVMTVILTKDTRKAYTVDSDGEYWTVTLFIKDSKSFDNTKDLNIAYEGGVGVGKFQAQLADFKEELNDILPGFHNMRFRFEQWDEAIKQNKAKRVCSVSQEIEWVEQRRAEMMDFWTLIENGTIPKRVSHNDTKINNVLFDATTSKSLCMIDLDTVLSSNVLNDFGDAIRTYTNTGKEDDENLANVKMDIKAFEAFAKGYISQTKSFLTQTEIEYLAFSGRFIVFEQVLRFLMDYINGDTYYKTKHSEHNLVRTKAQYALLQSIEQQYPQMVEIIKNSIN